MGTKSEMTVVFDALLTVPAMNDAVKVNLSMSRMHLLLLSNTIRQGIAAKDGMVSDLLSILPKESSEELAKIADEVLEKAGLAGLDQKIQKMGA
nr:hypothetical protein [Pedobacter sp. ASV19]